MDQFCRKSSCSLLKGTCSCGGRLLFLETRLARLSRSLEKRGDGFQSIGLPCIFQHVSFVCPCFLQWSHQGRPCRPRLSLGKDWKPQAACAWADSSLLTCCVPRDISADPSAVWLVLDVPSITFFLLSSRQTSEKASRIVGNGLVLNTRPQTSSRSLFKSQDELENSLSFNNLLVAWFIFCALPLMDLEKILLLPVVS